jgi:3-hydroxymyristoyl/3-hydroxydecanoyl-(acyl carrier protein) dehydratase
MLIVATVIIDGTQKGTIADLDGNYKLENINAGEITLICSFLSYESAKKTITVLPDKEIQLNFTLKESSSEIEGVEITTKMNRESENIVLIEQK